MKKLLLLFPVFLVMSVGCNSGDTAVTETKVTTTEAGAAPNTPGNLNIPAEAKQNIPGEGK